jgi:hypothetical protein
MLESIFYWAPVRVRGTQAESEFRIGKFEMIAVVFSPLPFSSLPAKEMEKMA